MEAIILLATLAQVAAAADSPALRWQTKLIALDVPAGAKNAVARFRFENTGSGPVEIAGIRTSCDCTAAISAQAVYPRGESGEIVATMTIGDRTGRQDKLITVTTTDGAGRKFTDTLMMRVQVPELVSCSTQLLTWSVGDAPSEKTVDISIAPSITAAHVSLNGVEPAGAEARLERRAATSYRLRLRPKSTGKTATFAVKLSVDAGSAGTRELEIFALVR